jgi:hypothetical protein
MKIGILVTATWRFIDFFPQLLKSLKNFCPGHERTIFLFSDSRDHFSDVVRIDIEHVPFPYVTLERYQRYLEFGYLYEDQDYLFHIDADMEVMGVGDEMLNNLTAVRHPYFLSDHTGSWEIRPESAAFVDQKLRKAYYCGGIQGGRADQYLKASAILANRIEVDKRNGVLATWHDESHWNWFLANYPGSFTELNAGYCFAEGKNIPFEKKIIALNKDKNRYRQ